MSEEQKVQRELLHKVKSALNYKKGNDLIESVEYIYARKDILEVNYRENTSFVTQIGITTWLGIHNSHLLYWYNQHKPLVGPLIRTIKAWGKEELPTVEVNSNIKPTICSYGLTLMAIFFLQRRNYLPVLQNDRPKKFNIAIRPQDLDFKNDLHLPKSQISLTLGQMLYGFFCFYAKFPFEEEIIDITIGQAVPRSSYDYPDSIPAMVKEPYEGSHVLRLIKTLNDLAEVKEAFQKAAQKLEESPTIEAIGLCDVLKKNTGFVETQGIEEANCSQEDEYDYEGPSSRRARLSVFSRLNRLSLSIISLLLITQVAMVMGVSPLICTNSPSVWRIKSTAYENNHSARSHRATFSLFRPKVDLYMIPAYKCSTIHQMAWYKTDLLNNPQCTPNQTTLDTSSEECWRMVKKIKVQIRRTSKQSHKQPNAIRLDVFFDWTKAYFCLQLRTTTKDHCGQPCCTRHKVHSRDRHSRRTYRL